MRPAAIRSVGIAAAEVFAFAAAAVLMTWPMAVHLADRVVNQGDPLLTSWVLPWTVRAIGTRPFDLFQGNIFHPEPNTLAYMDHMLAATPLAAPAWLATGDGILVNNVTVLILISLGGWSAYRLALDVTRSRHAAAVAGTIFAFSPFVFSHLSHTNLLTTYAMPAVWLFGRRVVREARTRDAVGLATFWVLSVLSSWYYAAFLSLSLAALVGAEAIVRRRVVAWRRVAVLFGGAAVVVGAVAFAVSRPYVAVQERYPQAVRTIGEAATYSSTPRSLLAPPPENRLYGEITKRFRAPVGFNEKTLFPGVVPAGLAAVAVFGAARRRRFGEVVPWLAAGGSMFVIAFGPYLSLGSFRLPLPFLVLYELAPPLRFIRAPGRAGGLVMLSVAVLAAMALARIERPRLRAVVCWLAVVLIGVEYASVPVKLAPAPHAAEAHRYLASSNVQGAVVELPTIPIVDGYPVPGTETREARYVAFSTTHWRPILNGYSGFFPPSHERMVYAMQDFPSQSSLDFLREVGVAFVTVHLDLLAGGPWEGLLAGIQHPGLELLVDDGKVRLYRLR